MENRKRANKSTRANNSKKRAMKNAFDLPYPLEECRFLSKEEEQRLFYLYRDTGDKEALEKLFKSQLRLAYQLVDRLKNKNKREDLCAEANYAILYAISVYDPTRGRLSTITTRIVKQRLSRFLQEDQYLIKLPISLLYIASKNKKEQKNIKEKLKPIEKMQYIDKESAENKVLTEDSIKNFIEEQESKKQTDLLYRKISLLNNKEKIIIRGFFGLEGRKRSTIKELAKKFQTDLRAIKRIYNRALIKLRMMGICKKCGKEFTPRKGFKYFCSWKCESLFKGDKYLRRCLICKRIFFANKKFRKLCSEGCATEYYKKKR